MRATLAPLPGEWTVPIALGPVRLQAGVPSAIRLATSWWAGPALRGRTLPTAHGRVQVVDAAAGHLLLRCAPCLLQPPGLGEDPLQLAEVVLTVQRQADRLSGEIRSGAVRGRWDGRLEAGRLRLRLDIPATPLADGYALLAGAIPEAAQARISGRFSLHATWSLPAGTLTVVPTVDGFTVDGLGTATLVGARSACSRRASRLNADSWLARAVVAAEDQRFHEHPGYDLAELAAALDRNQQAGRVERGGSTLSQQVAKLLVTGDERNAVRKLRELLYAVELEGTLGKARILRLYLDHAPWGEGLCGAEAAAQHYFGVRAHELTPGQAVWLAAMLRNPQREARQWAATGHIDLARAQWVALNLRGLSRTRKLQLVDDLAGQDWRPLWAEPPARRGG
ncbi:MAG: glycosyl transferase [Comamonadaceae bacterium]|nr:MAG: glycosyl transferase [Comamonadaceae bacterium]